MTQILELSNKKFKITMINMGIMENVDNNGKCRQYAEEMGNVS